MYSVCIATYNGSSYLSEQLQSILNELDSTGESYEVIVMDDCSTDNTVDIVRAFKNKNIFLSINERNIGHVKTFEKAIKASRGKYIFLSDQDDIWISGRINLMIAALKESKSEILFSGLSYIDEEGNTIVFNNNYKMLPPSSSRFYNILKMFMGSANYWGCTCLITRSSLDQVLPFYRLIEAHDLWIAQVGLANKSIHTISDITLEHRLHSNNVTPKKRRSLYRKIKTRLIFLMSYIYILK